MENFKSFITEEVKADKITVLILTNSKAKKPEIVTGMLLETCADLGLPCYRVVTTEAWVSDNDIEKGIVAIKNHDGGEKDIKVETASTVVFVRAGVLQDEVGLALLGTLQNAGCMMINDRDGMLTCDNKMSAYTAFERNNINTPRTSLINNEKSVIDAHDRIGGKFPVIIKTLTGTQGIGVSKVDSMESMMSVIQSLWKYNAPLIIQEFLQIEFDVRTIVLNGRIVASTKRIKPEKDFRSNRHMGAKTEPYLLSDEEKKEVLAAARATGAYMVGVDHIIHNNKPYLLEINGSPGSGADYEGYQHKDYYSDSEPAGRIDGEKMMANVVDWVQNRSHWDRQSLVETGWLETMDLDEIGKVRVKFDTGNGSKACALHADKILDSGKIVKWKYDGKTYSKPRHGTSEVFRANADGEEPSETRPTILLDMTFNGFTYKDVEVGLDARPRSGSDLLVNRDLMRLMNISVNPNRTFVLSKRLRPVEKDGKQDKVGFEKDNIDK